MSARSVTGVLRLGGGRASSSILIKISGKLGRRCSLEQIRAEIESILRDCGLVVSSFSVSRNKMKRAKRKKKA